MGLLDPIEGKLDQIKADLKRDIQIEIVTEGVKVGLSRLATLDPDNAAKYASMVAQL